MPSNGKTGPVQMQRTPRACPLSLRRGDCQERGDTSVQRRTSQRCSLLKQMCGHRRRFCTSSAPLNLSGAGLEVEGTALGNLHRVLNRRRRVVVVSPPAESAPALLRLVAFGTSDDDQHLLHLKRKNNK